MRDPIHSHRSGAAGFTLLELSIVLIVSGLVMALFLGGYSLYRNSAAYDLTRENLSSVDMALQSYRGSRGQYPCPADPMLAPGDAHYGRAAERCNVCVDETTTVYLDDAQTVASNILCRQGLRDADGDGANDFVLVGMVPFVTLANDIEYSEWGFREHMGFDGYNNAFAYAVSANMTDRATSIGGMINSALGAITMIDENASDLSEPPNSTQYVVFSAGENAVGAYNGQGNIVNEAECFVSSSGDPIPDGIPPDGYGDASGIAPDKVNCNRNNTIFMKGLYSPNDGNNHFDDLILYRNYFSMEIWNQRGEHGLYNVNFGNVGVNTNAPERKLDVNGHMKVENKVRAENGFCDNGDGILRDCMDVALFADYEPTDEAHQCPQGQVAVGVQNNALICRDLVPSGASVNYRYTCTLANGGPYITGLTYDVQTRTFYPSGCSETPGSAPPP